MYAFDTLLMFLFGSVLWQIPRSDIERERLIRVAVAHPERTPRLVQNAGELGQRDPEQYFEHGIQTIIAGMEARLHEGRR